MFFMTNKLCIRGFLGLLSLFGTRKLEWCGCRNAKKFGDIFSRFDSIPLCDGQIDGHLATDRIVRAYAEHRVAII